MSAFDRLFLPLVSEPGFALNVEGSTDMLSLGLGLNSVLVSSTRIFTPAMLFANDEPGIWLDPSDLSTLFQERTGASTPALVGDPVGTVLDKSRGLVRGPELYPGGTFEDNMSFGTSGFAGKFITWRSDLHADSFTVDGDVINFNGNAGGFRFDVSGLKRIEITFSGNTEGIELRLANASGAAFGDNSQSTAESGVLFAAQADCSSINAPYFRFQGPAGSVVIESISIRELPGNHATAPSDAARPILGRVPVTGRRNLLERTEEFEDAVWAKIRASVVPNAAVAPDGTLTADKAIANTDNNTHRVDQNITLNEGETYTYSIYAKAAEYDGIAMRIGAGAVSTDFARFDLTNGTAFTTGDAVADITDVGNGWYRCICTMAAGTTDRIVTGIWDGATQSFAGDGTSGIFIWGAQLELGSTATPYQRVGSQFDVTEAGVRDAYYLSFDGVDDALTFPDSTLIYGPSEAWLGYRYEAGQTFAAGWRNLGTGGGQNRFQVAHSSNDFGATGVSTSPQVTGTDYVIGGSVADIDETTQTAYRIGSTPVTGAVTRAGVQGNLNLFGTGFDFAQGRFYGGLVIGRVLTEVERTNVQKFLARKTPGVTL